MNVNSVYKLFKHNYIIMIEVCDCTFSGWNLKQNVFEGWSLCKMGKTDYYISESVKYWMTQLSFMKIA